MRHQYLEEPGNAGYPVQECGEMATAQPPGTALRDTSLKEQSRMKRADEVTIPMRIVVERPVVAERHSLQTKDNRPFDAKESSASAARSVDCTGGLTPGPQVLGLRARPYGPARGIG